MESRSVLVRHPDASKRKRKEKSSAALAGFAAANKAQGRAERIRTASLGGGGATAGV